MLTDEQRTDLAHRGITYVRELIPRERAAAIEDRIWAFLGKRGIHRTDRATWPPGGLMSGVQGLRQAEVFAPFTNEHLIDVANELLGAGAWTKFRHDAQALLSFPESGPWQIPHKLWHFDMPARGPTDRFDAVRVLGFVSRVAPQGGGTLLVEGSHELTRRMVERAPGGNAGQSADVRRRLAGRSPWFKALQTEGADRIARFMVDGDEIDGVSVRVVEATGDGGDVCIMHPWTLHTTAMNCADRPRMMLSQTFLRDDNVYYAR